MAAKRMSSSSFREIVCAALAFTRTRVQIPKAGIPAWRSAYDALQKDYGKVSVPDVHVTAKSDPVNADVLAIAAATNADVTGQTIMAPAKQPSAMHVIGRFWTGNVEGRKWYYVALFFDDHA